MCQIKIDSLKEHKSILIYNQIFVQTNVFTVEDIVNQINEKCTSKKLISLDEVEYEIDKYLKIGLLRQHVKGYSIRLTFNF
ncbi:MAG: hypothetical protein NC310_07145 [Roseburia sp.]|nr:hypothetical protein [Roseburia sp.]MCM1557808.1 hypothetical protein [Anaeroplasma bactoclasticum]